MTIRTNVFATWMTFVEVYRSRGAAKTRLRELGVHKETLLRLSAISDDLDKVSKTLGLAGDRLDHWRDARWTRQPWSPWESTPAPTDVTPRRPRPARWADAWTELRTAHGRQQAAQALLDIGIPKNNVQHIQAVDEALQNVYNLSGDMCRRDNAIVKAVALGVPPDTVGQSAGITRERVRQIWKNSGRTDKPWRAQGG